MTKQLEDYPELHRLTSNLREWAEKAETLIFFYDDAECDQMCLVEDTESKLLEQQHQIDYLTEHLELCREINDRNTERVLQLTEQNKELQDRNSQLSEYRFKHPETGDEKLVMINRQFIVDRLIDEIYERIECNCTAFAEDYDFCDCNEYFEQFELVELNKESK